MNKVLVILLAFGLLLSGCCGGTKSAAETKPEEDKYFINYGKTAVAENMHITLNKIDEGHTDEEGLRDYTVEFTVRNDGKEEDSVPGAFYLVDTQDRYFEANYFTCSFLINPGVQKTDGLQIIKLHFLSLNKVARPSHCFFSFLQL